MRVLLWIYIFYWKVCWKEEGMYITSNNKHAMDKKNVKISDIISRVSSLFFFDTQIALSTSCKTCVRFVIRSRKPKAVEIYNSFTFKKEEENSRKI